MPGCRNRPQNHNLGSPFPNRLFQERIDMKGPRGDPVQRGQSQCPASRFHLLKVISKAAAVPVSLAKQFFSQVVWIAYFGIRIMRTDGPEGTYRLGGKRRTAFLHSNSRSHPK